MYNETVMKSLIYAAGLKIGLYSLFLILLLGCVQTSSETDTPINKTALLKESLAEDFLKAYDNKPISNNIVEVSFTAKEDTLEIFENSVQKAWAYNGSIPGPIIRIKLGDTLRINFTNELPQSTTIHFHGIRVPNAMDGVPGVTQPPIEPGEGFTYEFKPKEPGTYWFHPHVRGTEQLERGLYGAIIVEDNLEFDKDEVVFIDDWLITKEGDLYENFDSRHAAMMNGRWGNVLTANGKYLYTINLNSGERLRLRLINSANARIFNMTHNSSTEQFFFAVDGFYTREPMEFTWFDMGPGNRLDLDIVANESFVIYEARERRALIYINVTGEGQISRDPLPINQHIPALENASTLEPDREYVYEITMKPGIGPVWTINGKSWPDYEPYVFKGGEFNVIRLTDRSRRIHPIHFHGLFFKVIRRNGEFVDEGFYRDTVILYPNDVVDVALVPVDKGTWVNHCHIQEHAERGFMTAIEVI